MELYATPAEVLLYAALPGLAGPEHVAVTLLSPTELVLEAYVAPDAPGLPLHCERQTGYCYRALAVPVPVRPEGARAHYRDGILELRLPRSEPGTGTGTVSLLQVDPVGPQQA